MKKHLSTLLLVAVFLLGVCIMLYPTVSDYWNSLHQTRAIGAYEDALAEHDPARITTPHFQQAEDYNAGAGGAGRAHVGISEPVRRGDGFMRKC